MILRRRPPLAGVLLAVLAGASWCAAAEPVIGGPCEGCELVFAGMPETPAVRARIAPPGEPGEPMTIEGSVSHGDGTPAAGVVVYAYHTDAMGVYPTAATRHGRLRGWARTDAAGRYRFDTIRPGGYPGRQAPQHVHMHVVERGRGTYWVDELQFTDDPLLPASRRRASRRERGGSGVVTPTRDADGVWQVRRDIRLGEAVPDYGGR
jgi:protocatechuate 3,4-dioxygenase beta subunit